eukprot:279714-Pleurochrysis_carterae.AAC.1
MVRARGRGRSGAAAARGGEDVDVPPVPTVVIEQSKMAPWARGAVWDCADPARCVPVKRSTRHTRFEGARQIDRAALRAAASALQWADTGI